MTEKPCVECGGELPPGAAAGRPRSYCGDACRRMAEYRIARARRLCEWLERQLVGTRVDAKGHRDYMVSKAAPSRVKVLEKELDAAEGRLRDLLAGARDHKDTETEGHQ